MRERYTTTTTTNEALIALAIRLQWIEIAIDIHQDERSPIAHVGTAASAVQAKAKPSATAPQPW